MFQMQRHLSAMCAFVDFMENFVDELYLHTKCALLRPFILFSVINLDERVIALRASELPGQAHWGTLQIMDIGLVSSSRELEQGETEIQN